jgi:hypothetical protein
MLLEHLIREDASHKFGLIGYAANLTAPLPRGQLKSCGLGEIFVDFMAKEHQKPRQKHFACQNCLRG